MTRSATGASEAPNDVAEQPAPHRPDFDAATEAARISDALREAVLRTLKRRGLIVGLSGGVDSTVTAALGAAALGKARVLGVLMPERDSDPDSLRLGRLAAESLGIECVLEDIGSALDATGCYERRDAFIRQIVPSYGPGWRCKIGLSEETSGSGFGVSYLIVENPSGERARHRMTAEVYRGVIAAANMKQRIRKQIEYYHADRLGYAVAGTPNRLEYDQGFFVKNGDGAADVKPIAHLYKTQVYHLAQFFGAPEEIRLRPPTTDTWPLAQSQEEFYFLAPYQIMDICLDGLNRGLAADETAKSAGIEPERVHLLWRDIQAKRKATSYLHQPPILCG